MATTTDGESVRDAENGEPHMRSGPKTARASHLRTDENNQVPISHQARQEANQELIRYMMSVLQDGRIEAEKLNTRLRWTYWILITFSTILFLFGLVLLSSPLWVQSLLTKLGNGETAVSNTVQWFATFFPPVLGIADLFALYLFDPIRRINRLMGDMSQLIVILNNYNIRVALRLVEFDVKKRRTVGNAADHMKTIAGYTLSSIARHFEDGLVYDRNE